MPFSRNKEFYDLVANGLSSIGYKGPSAFHAYVNDVFAKKYNAEKTFAKMGFPLNPNIPLNPTYEQLEATVTPYTMASYVDIDSDGPSKGVGEISLKMGTLPTFKHEFNLDRKTLREKMMLKEAIGDTNQSINNTILGLLYNANDTLIGGNYNTMKYQRNQVVSNECKLIINKENNPMGYALQIDFGVDSKNKRVSKWYTKSGDGSVTAVSDLGTKVNPISVLKDIKYNAENRDGMADGHFELSKKTWNNLMTLDYFREMYSVAMRPDITDAANRLAYGKMVGDNDIRMFLEKVVGAEIHIIDDVSCVDKYNAETGKPEVARLDSFKEGVIVYMPNGNIGDTQFGKPLAMQTPGSRVALFDGGRTMIRQIFQDRTMTQTVQSECTGLVVPNKVRWMYYLTIA